MISQTVSLSNLRADSLTNAQFWTAAHKLGMDEFSFGAKIERASNVAFVNDKIIQDLQKDIPEISNAIQILHEATTSGSGTKSSLFHITKWNMLCMVTGTKWNYLVFEVIGKNRDQVAKIIEWAEAKYPPPISNDTNISVEFWYNTGQGPRSISRMIDSPNWSEIESNYTLHVRSEINRLLDPKWRPSTGGQLMLLQGKPGTGKTYLIRAFAKEIKSWCAPYYITDPDQLLSDSAYMMNVLLDETPSTTVIEEIFGEEVYDDESGKEDLSRWKLLILEDAGELLAKDSRSKTGQALSKLLNITDGMIGQGLKILLLVTTNEELGDLHDAIQRPGRCISKVKFDALSRDESNAWLEAHKSTLRVTQATTIAELYAMLAPDYRIPANKQSFGLGK